MTAPLLNMHTCICMYSFCVPRNAGVWQATFRGVPRANFNLNYFFCLPPTLVYKICTGFIDSVNHQTYNFIFHKCDKIFYLFIKFMFSKGLFHFCTQGMHFCVTGFWEIPVFVTRTSQLRRFGRPILWSKTKLRMELLNATVSVNILFLTKGPYTLQKYHFGWVNSTVVSKLQFDLTCWIYWAFWTSKSQETLIVLNDAVRRGGLAQSR